MATDDPTHLDSVFPWLLKPVPLASEDDSSVEVVDPIQQMQMQPEVEIAVGS